MRDEEEAVVAAMVTISERIKTVSLPTPFRRDPSSPSLLTVSRATFHLPSREATKCTEQGPRR